ncbi:MAG: hypothetical protein HQK98_10110 [Nitrospirae bacterium]|nr:hypothetical protein [Nitrospirota bacterium]
MMTTYGTINRRLVIITNEQGAADESLAYMMGFAISISNALDIMIICDDCSLRPYLQGKSNAAHALDTIISTGRNYNFEVTVELYTRSHILTLKDNINNKRGLSMVLLSPALNINKVFDLRKILKEVSVPVWQYRTREVAPVRGKSRKGGTTWVR